MRCDSHVGLYGVLDIVYDLIHHRRLQAVSSGNTRLPCQEAADGHGLADLLTLNQKCSKEIDKIPDN